MNRMAPALLVLPLVARLIRDARDRWRGTEKRPRARDARDFASARYAMRAPAGKTISFSAESLYAPRDEELADGEKAGRPFTLLPFLGQTHRFGSNAAREAVWRKAAEVPPTDLERP